MNKGSICPAGQLKFSLRPSGLPAAIIPQPQFASLDNPAASRMSQSLASMRTRAQSLVKFVDEYRDEAGAVGVETIGIEVGSILDSGKLDRVASELQRSTSEGRKSEISPDGMDTVIRLELLLSDSDRRKGSHLGSAQKSSNANSVMGGTGSLGATPTDSTFVLLGFGGLILLLALLAG